jgi:nitrous oxidase accessory protein NosD
LHISNSDAHDNTVKNNDIEANQSDGVLIDGDAADNVFSGNSIVFNAGAGVRVVNGRGNRIVRNDIDVNDGIGIDLADEGVTANDNDSMPPSGDYANRGQNFPTLTSAKGGHTGIVSGTLATTPGDYTINLYGSVCDPSGYGEGQRLFDYSLTGGDGYKITVPNLTVQGQGAVSFSIPVVKLPNMFAQTYVMATATDANGDTSEFSACLAYQDDGIFYDGFEDRP